MHISAKKIILDCVDLALKVSSPNQTLPRHLPTDNKTAVTVISVGKAASSMAVEFEKYWQGSIKGLAVVPYHYREPLKYFEQIEASHPIPDQMSVRAAGRVFELTNSLNSSDTVFVLLSGGSSSLICYPAGSINFLEKQKINCALIRSGANINEINCVRKQLSAIKGGRLAAHCRPAKVYTFAISDVVGDDPSIIGSGPTIADPTTPNDAIKILDKYDITTPASISHWLKRVHPEKDNLDNKSKNYTIISSGTMMLDKVAQFSKKSNLDIINLGELEGDACDIAWKTATYLANIKPKIPTLLISGGEATVKLKGDGRGGPNSEYLLSLALNLKGNKNIFALAVDTDGIDGSEDNAGAIITPNTLKDAQKIGLDLEAMLKNNDSYSAFLKLNSLILTGPTGTNVNDFRATLILPE